jgi:enoyl-CoA hydratase/carnithine racemase
MRSRRCWCGDIRFFHQAAWAGDPRLEDFFSEEYALNHLIHHYPKPYIALMDGICMGGGMGIAQGAALRVVTEHSKLAMPETHIGLFPDVGGGWFLARLAGSMGEYLALTGAVLNAADAIAVGLADVQLRSGDLPALVEALSGQPPVSGAEVLALAQGRAVAPETSALMAQAPAIDRHFSAPTLAAICASLAAEPSDFAQRTLATLRQRSPLMMAVTLELVRRARGLTLAEDLRLERDLVRHCFALRPVAHSETVEGIRALAIDKDHAPRWNPTRLEDIAPTELAAFFASPWPPHAHPLRDLR